MPDGRRHSPYRDPSTVSKAVACRTGVGVGVSILRYVTQKRRRRVTATRERSLAPGAQAV